MSARTHYDGERPVTRWGLLKPFEDVRARAGLDWFCLNGLRHTAITRMAEAGISIGIIMSRAGHMTAKMTAHYTHVSEQAERKAMGRIGQTFAPPVDIAQYRSGTSGY